MRRLAMGMIFGASLFAGCYSAEFTQTAPYPVTPRASDAVQVLTQRPGDGTFREVGIVSAQGAGFQGALARAKEQAAEHGCDAIVVLSEAVESGRGVPGSAYGMTRSDLRCTCLVHGTVAAAR